MAEEEVVCDPSLADLHLMTRSFLRSAYDGDIDAVSTMLKDGIPVDVCNSAGLQGIHFAAKTGDVEMVETLLQHGALVNAKSQKGNTPLHVASLIGNREVVKLLLRKGASCNVTSECNEDNFTPLYMAAQIGHQEIVTLLLAHGADPTIPTVNGSTSRDVALQQGHQVVAELLEEYERRIKQTSNGEIESTSSLFSTPIIPTRQGSGSRSGSVERIRRRPPAVYNRDVIPSPRNSPMKTKTTISNARITNLIQDAT